MSSFFNKLKNSVQKAIGLKSPSRGRRLGGDSGPDSFEADNYEDESSLNLDAVSLDSIYKNPIYDITFTTEVIGIGVAPDKDGLPRVAVINNPKLSQDHPIQVNDIVIAVDNNDVLSFDSFMEVIIAVDRPVTIRLVATPTSYR